MSVASSASEGGFYTTAQRSLTPVACASFTDTFGVPLESIRDQGTCLDASNAVYGGSDIKPVTTYQVWASHGVACSGCFAFTDEVQCLTGPCTKVRFCDYDASVGFDGLLGVPQNSDIHYFPLCISSLSPSPPPPSPPPPSPPPPSLPPSLPPSTPPTPPPPTISTRALPLAGLDTLLSDYLGPPLGQRSKVLRLCAGPRALEDTDMELAAAGGGGLTLWADGAACLFINTANSNRRGYYRNVFWREHRGELAGTACASPGIWAAANGSPTPRCAHSSTLRSPRFSSAAVSPAGPIAAADASQLWPSHTRPKTNSARESRRRGCLRGRQLHPPRHM